MSLNGRLDVIESIDPAVLAVKLILSFCHPGPPRLALLPAARYVEPAIKRAVLSSLLQFLFSSRSHPASMDRNAEKWQVSQQKSVKINYLPAS